MNAWLAEPEWDDGGDAWFRRMIGRYLDNIAGKGGPYPPTVRQPLRDADVRLETVEWFAARRPEFTEWEDDDGYVPEEPCGQWVIDPGAVNAGLADAVAAARDRVLSQREANAYGTLDAWLVALDRSALDWRGPRESAAPSLLSADARARYLYAHHEQLRRWPRLCADCRVEFRDRDDLHAARCPKCTAPRRRVQRRGNAKR